MLHYRIEAVTSSDQKASVARLQMFIEVHTCIYYSSHKFQLCISTVYCKLFKVEKFCGFRRSIGKHKTFTVKHFHLVLKMVGHDPGSSLKEFL